MSDDLNDILGGARLHRCGTDTSPVRLRQAVICRWVELDGDSLLSGAQRGAVRGQTGYVHTSSRHYRGEMPADCGAGQVFVRHRLSGFDLNEACPGQVDES